MANYYYSGQGSLYVGTRNPTTGRPEGLVAVGNVPTLEISIEVEKFEHKESETGNRTVDLTIIQEQNATFNLVIESFSTRNLALAFFGTESEVTGAAVASEAQTLYQPADASDTDPYKTPLDHINLNEAIPAVLVDSLLAAMTEGVDYEVDYKNGSIWPLAAWSGAALPDVIDIGYTHLGYPQMSAFTQTTIERYLRFEGINTVNDDAVVIDLFRAEFDPAQAFPLINDEVGQLTLNGTILQDVLNVSTGSEFFTERKSIDVP
jgi:hypothetical protein